MHSTRALSSRPSISPSARPPLETPDKLETAKILASHHYTKDKAVAAEVSRPVNVSVRETAKEAAREGLPRARASALRGAGWKRFRSRIVLLGSA